MTDTYLDSLFSLHDQVAVVTGGGGILCTLLCLGLSRAGAKVAVFDIHETSAQKTASLIVEEGGKALAVACDVLDKNSIETAAKVVHQRFGSVHILINGAGGNKPEATTDAESLFFDLPIQAIRDVFDLNILGTLLPCQIFGKDMADRGDGAIINIASMNSFRPLTRIPAYSAAKAAVVNFTRWLAVHMSQEYSPRIRVNAIAPGFLLTEQNRYLLTDASTGELTLRGQKIIDHIPQGCFQTPEELISTVVWLVSPGASAVTGIVVPVDGGFSAYSGI